MSTRCIEHSNVTLEMLVLLSDDVMEKGRMKLGEALIAALIRNDNNNTAIE